MMIETILIANTAEAFEDLLLRTSSTDEGQRRMRHELALSQRAFFWESDNKAVITPYAIPARLLEYNQAQCDFSNTYNWFPGNPQGVNLSKMILADEDIKNLIANAARENPALKLSPYAITEDFLSLVDVLRGLDINLQVAEQPLTEALWTTRYLDSKAGFRAEMLKLAGRLDLKIPEGFIVGDKKEILEICSWFWAKGKSFVLKANYGESGWGLKIVKLQDYSSFQTITNKLSELFENDPVWENTLIAVEEYIKPNTVIAGGSPSSEVLISDNGYQITYHCGQLLDPLGGFLGVEIGKDALPAKLEKRLVNIAELIAQRYWELGYRGFFDIDFVISQSNDLYLMETNTRRTGGTHVYDLARFLFGETWHSDAYFLSHDSLSYGTGNIKPEALLDKIAELAYPMNGKREGVIVTLLSPQDPIMGYVVIAPNAQLGRQLQQNLFKVFGI